MLNQLQTRDIAMAFHEHSVAGKVGVPSHIEIIANKERLQSFDFSKHVADKIKVRTHSNGKETLLPVNHLIEFLENPNSFSYFEKELEAVVQFDFPENVIEKLSTMSHTLTMLKELIEIKRHQELLRLESEDFKHEDKLDKSKKIHHKHDIVAKTVDQIHGKIMDAMLQHDKNFIPEFQKNTLIASSVRRPSAVKIEELFAGEPLGSA